jgi:hypothetical protein
MVRDRESGRFVYVEQMERRRGETPWRYARRSFRREGQIRTSFDGETLEVIVGWGMSSIEEFLRAYPEYGPGDAAGSPASPDGRYEHAGLSLPRRRFLFHRLLLEVLRGDPIHPVLELVNNLFLGGVLHRLLEDDGGLLYHLVGSVDGGAGANGDCDGV